MRTRFTEKEHTGAGLALALIVLLAGSAARFRPATAIVILCLLVLMTKPVVFYPFTVVWLNLSDLLGRIMSRVLLAVIYCLLVVPFGLVRKLAGKDPLMLKAFGKTDATAFKTRDHRYTREDLLHPY